MYHPCVGGAGREWVPKEYDLNTYTVKRMVDETRMTNVFLQSLDGKTKRTFAFTCGEMKIGDSSFINAMKKDFVAARAVQLLYAQVLFLYPERCRACLQVGLAGHRAFSHFPHSGAQNFLFCF